MNFIVNHFGLLNDILKKESNCLKAHIFCATQKSNLSRSFNYKYSVQQANDGVLFWDKFKDI